MYKLIIYPSQEIAGQLCIVVPVSNIPIEIIAKKDVPIGVPYVLLKENEIPSDFIFKDAWEYDFSNPHGYGMGFLNN
jgi:hypothetical protein